MKTKFFALIFALFSFTTAYADEGKGFTQAEDVEFAKTLDQGAQLIQGHKQQEAIAAFEKVSTAYEEKYKDTPEKIYCARNATESLVYLTKSAIGDKPQSAIVLSSPNWAYAYFLKGYALIDLGKLPEARASIQKALDLMPDNAQFIGEIGHLYQIEKNWDLQIQTFKQMEHAADLDPNTKSIYLPRAWRGIAFALTEQGKFDESESYYKKCLDMNPNDHTAQNELRYIQMLKAKGCDKPC